MVKMTIKAKEKKRIQVQLDKNVAEKAESIIEQLGMTPTTAINIFYKRVIANDGIPFDVHLTERERAIKDIQKYSKLMPIDVLDTPEKVSDWLNDDDWE